MKLKDLIFKTITVNHSEKFANVYIHKDVNFDPSDGLLTLASNLFSIGLDVSLKDQVFDQDIVELFDWGMNSSEEPIAILKIGWNKQFLCWDFFSDKNDYRLFGDSPEDEYDKWRTNPRTINNSIIPIGYEVRTFIK